jgi:hypothetical protein
VLLVHATLLGESLKPKKRAGIARRQLRLG